MSEVFEGVVFCEVRVWNIQARVWPKVVVWCGTWEGPWARAQEGLSLVVAWMAVAGCWRGASVALGVVSSLAAVGPTGRWLQGAVGMQANVEPRYGREPLSHGLRRALKVAKVAVLAGLLRVPLQCWRGALAC